MIKAVLSHASIFVTDWFPGLQTTGSNYFLLMPADPRVHVSQLCCECLNFLPFMTLYVYFWPFGVFQAVKDFSEVIVVV